MMDERCSSYIDFAANGMMNESRREGVRVSTLHSRRERKRDGERNGEYERVSE